MTARRLLGVVICAAPFVAILAAAVASMGWLGALTALGGGFAIFGVLWVGVALVMGDGR